MQPDLFFVICISEIGVEIGIFWNLLFTCHIWKQLNVVAGENKFDTFFIKLLSKQFVVISVKNVQNSISCYQ